MSLPLSSPTPFFPTYFVPSFYPSCRTPRTSSKISSASRTSFIRESSATQDDDLYLPGYSSYLRCAHCLADLIPSHQIISKGFTGRHGRAYLVSPSPSSLSPNPMYLQSAKARNEALPNLPNTIVHKPVPRQLATGAHTVGDVACQVCGTVLGWKYIAAEEEAQRYKVGKFILETKRVCRTGAWDVATELGQDHEKPRISKHVNHPPSASTSLAPRGLLPVRPVAEDVEFDSQDEDECEDLFLGVWSPQLATRRRKFKSDGKLF